MSSADCSFDYEFFPFQEWNSAPISAVAPFSLDSEEFRGSKFFPCTMVEKAASSKGRLMKHPGFVFSLPVIGFKLASTSKSFLGNKVCSQKRSGEDVFREEDFRQFTDGLDFSLHDVPNIPSLDNIRESAVGSTEDPSAIKIGISNTAGFRLSSRSSSFMGSGSALGHRSPAVLASPKPASSSPPCAEFHQASTPKPSTVLVPEPAVKEEDRHTDTSNTPLILPPIPEVLEVSGKNSLDGHVRISGAKNSALALLAGTVLSSEQLRICNVPNLGDIRSMVQVLQSLGAQVWRGDGMDGDGDGLYVDPSHLSSCAPPLDIARQLRASFFLIGPLLARLGEAHIPLPGGCDIGMRPVELFIVGLKAMGAEIELVHGVVMAKAPTGGRLRGAQIFMDYPSVGATESLMMAATLADGETVIHNAAKEPEVVDVANFCKSMGASIEGAGTDTIVIRGKERLHGTDYTTIPDRIEAGTFLVAGAITRSEISMGPVVPEHLTAVTAKLEEMGCRILSDTPDILRIKPADRLVAADIKTLPHPGFPTDMQAQLMSLLTVCEGTGVICETVFEKRFRHAAELARMGANIRQEGSVAVVTGVESLSGAHVQATDLRASAALVLAGLAADGTTTVHDLIHLDRGYERFDHKLRQLGATVDRLHDLSPLPPLP